VENAVGFVRRNLMVPVPSAEGFDALTPRGWRVVRLGSRIQGSLPARDVPIAALFASD
jgi:hypothetical protein